MKKNIPSLIPPEGIEPAKIRLMVGVPSQGFWNADMGMSFGFMLAHLMRALPMTHVWYAQNVKTSILPQSREELAMDALDIGATHLLMIDSDMKFPADTAARLLRFGQCPIVAVNAVNRGFPCYPTARDEDKKPILIPKGEPGGLKKVWRVGCGIMLIRTDILHNMPQPWFLPLWEHESKIYDSEHRHYTGEDWAFVARAQEAGHSVYVDQKLSLEVLHQGSYDYGHKDVEYPEEAQSEAPALVLPVKMKEKVA